jgi:hypothetical protein
MTAPAATTASRSAPAFRQFSAQFGHSARSLWRSIIAAVFTFAMPIAWLVLIGFVAGNAVIEESTRLRVMQFATPSAIAMGAFFATFPAVAVAVGEARERLILKRQRGLTPDLVHTRLLLRRLPRRDAGVDGRSRRSLPTRAPSTCARHRVGCGRPHRPVGRRCGPRRLGSCSGQHGTAHRTQAPNAVIADEADAPCPAHTAADSP